MGAGGSRGAAEAEMETEARFVLPSRRDPGAG